MVTQNYVWLLFVKFYSSLRQQWLAKYAQPKSLRIYFTSDFIFYNLSATDLIFVCLVEALRSLSPYYLVIEVGKTNLLMGMSVCVLLFSIQARPFDKRRDEQDCIS